MSSEWRKLENISEFATICLKEKGQLTVTRIKGSIEVTTNLDERNLWINNCQSNDTGKATRMKESGVLTGIIKK